MFAVGISKERDARRGRAITIDNKGHTSLGSASGSADYRQTKHASEQLVSARSAAIMTDSDGVSFCNFCIIKLK